MTKKSRPMVAAAVLATGLASTLIGAPSAVAAPMTNSTAVPLTSASADLGGYQISGLEPTTATVFHLDVAATATWTGSLTTDVGWDSNQVRQGASLSVNRAAPQNAGNIDVEWTVTGTVSPFGAGDISIGTIGLSNNSVSCALELSGTATYDCQATSNSVHLIQTPGVPLSPYVDLAIQVDFTVSPTGAVVGRGFSIGGTDAAPPANLSLTDSTQSESFAVPCSAPPGASVSYALSPFDWAPSTSASQQPVVQIGVMDPILGVAELPAIADIPFGSAVNSTPVFDLNGSGETVDLGSLLPNNVPPTIAAFSPFSGTEGTPVQFSATTTSQCPITSYVWSFSDGTAAYGPSPRKTFNDGGVYSGRLTVTDETGLSATQDFTVNVADAPPTANAGPDTTAAWGQNVSFNGQALAAGSDEQSTLQYAWYFGDGTPSATGSASAVHAYATPGDYTAVLTVCSEDGLCALSTRQVVVVKRDTSTAYTGDTSGTFDTPGTLAASVVDAFGMPVNGASVQFQIGTDTASALTGAGGTATTSYTPTLAAGTYNVAATFAGNSLYNPSSSLTNPFPVAQKATTVTYTGATSSRPNKSVSLSAVLRDATGKSLAGQTIVFHLGSQTTSAVTNASGVASATLVLNQHVGNYSLSATYAGDPSYYLGSSTVTVFNI